MQGTQRKGWVLTHDGRLVVFPNNNNELAPNMRVVIMMAGISNCLDGNGLNQAFRCPLQTAGTDVAAIEKGDWIF